jgi:hypothetical protein
MRYGQEADEPITFRYVLGLLRDQRKADLAIKLNEIGWSINIAGSLDDLRGIASTLAGMDIDTVQREAFVSDIKETARLLGIKLPITTVRQMLKPRPDEVETPDWLLGWAFLRETSNSFTTLKAVSTSTAQRSTLALCAISMISRHHDLPCRSSRYPFTT